MEKGKGKEKRENSYSDGYNISLACPVQGHIIAPSVVCTTVCMPTKCPGLRGTHINISWKIVHFWQGGFRCSVSLPSEPVLQPSPGFLSGGAGRVGRRGPRALGAPPALPSPSCSLLSLLHILLPRMIRMTQPEMSRKMNFIILIQLKTFCLVLSFCLHPTPYLFYYFFFFFFFLKRNISMYLGRWIVPWAKLTPDQMC